MREEMVAEAYAAGQRYAAAQRATPVPKTNPGLLTTGPAAKQLGVHPNTIRKMVRRHELRCELTATGARLFRLGELIRAGLERLDRAARRQEELLAQRRFWMVASAYEPRQLDLLALVDAAPRARPDREPVQLTLPGPRLVQRSGSETGVEDAPRAKTRSGLKTQGSEKRYFVKRKRRQAS